MNFAGQLNLDLNDPGRLKDIHEFNEPKKGNIILGAQTIKINVETLTDETEPEIQLEISHLTEINADGNGKHRKDIEKVFLTLEKGEALALAKFILIAFE